ncbi:hypothetical protein H1C71_028984 [Ictidomys tridecemlineatus]|nr:hypothetical protein H1C71_028984 [Ictidomys tridecemlineatus]
MVTAKTIGEKRNEGRAAPSDTAAGSASIITMMIIREDGSKGQSIKTDSSKAKDTLHRLSPPLPFLLYTVGLAPQIGRRGRPINHCLHWKQEPHQGFQQRDFNPGD